MVIRAAKGLSIFEEGDLPLHLTQFLGSDDRKNFARTSKASRRIVIAGSDRLKGKDFLPGFLERGFSIALIGFLNHQDRVHLSCTSKIAERTVKYVRNQEEVYFRKELKPFFGENQDSAFYRFKVNTFLLQQKFFIPVLTRREVDLHQSLRAFLENLPIIDEAQESMDRLNVLVLISIITNLLNYHPNQIKPFLDSLEEIQNPFKKAARIREWLLAHKKIFQEMFSQVMEQSLQKFLRGSSIECLEKVMKELSIVDKVEMGKIIARQKAKILIRFFEKLAQEFSHLSEGKLLLDSLEAVQNPIEKAQAIRKWILDNQEYLHANLSSSDLESFIYRERTHSLEEGLDIPIPEEITLFPNIYAITYQNMLNLAISTDQVHLVIEIFEDFAKHFSSESNDMFSTIFDDSIRLPRTSIIRWCIHHERFNNFSAAVLGKALHQFADYGYEAGVQKIFDHPKFKDISPEDLGKALLNSAVRGFTDIVQKILDCHRFHEISPEDLNQALEDLRFVHPCQFNREAVLLKFLHPKIATRLPIPALVSALNISVRQSRSEVFKQLFACGRFHDIPDLDFIKALHISAGSGHIMASESSLAIAQQLFNCHRFQQIFDRDLVRELVESTTHVVGPKRTTRILISDRVMASPIFHSLGRILENSAQDSNKKSLEKVFQCIEAIEHKARFDSEQLRQLFFEYIGKALHTSVQNGDQTIVHQLLNQSLLPHSFPYWYPHHYHGFQDSNAILFIALKSALTIKATKNEASIAQELLNCGQSAYLDSSDMKDILKFYIDNRRWASIRPFVDSGHFDRLSTMTKAFALSHVWHIPEIKAILQPKMTYWAIFAAYFLSFNPISLMVKNLMNRLKIDY